MPLRNSCACSTSTISRDSSGENARPSAIVPSSAASPSAVTRLLRWCSNARSSSTPRLTSTPPMRSASRLRCTVSTPTTSSSRFVARLLLVAIMCSASSLMRIVEPTCRCTSAFASRSRATRNALPSHALRKRLRMWTRDCGTSRPSWIASYTPTRIATLIVLAAWNHRSAWCANVSPVPRSRSATASALGRARASIASIFRRSGSVDRVGVADCGGSTWEPIEAVISQRSRPARSGVRRAIGPVAGRRGCARMGRAWPRAVTRAVTRDAPGALA